MSFSQVKTPLNFFGIFRFWLPLAGSWLLMAVEGTIITALIARLPDAKINLAAYGVAFALGLILEAPIIMMMTASTALVQSQQSLRILKKFSHQLNILCTVGALLVCTPMIYAWIVPLLNINPQVEKFLWTSLILLIPWPGSIGVRRFYQGILIRAQQTGKVVLGTEIRLAVLITCCLVGYNILNIPGSYIGCAALSIAVVIEALVIYIMARPFVDELPEFVDGENISAKSILHFYLPLALTSILALVVQPIITFFMGWSQNAIESRAVLPVVLAFAFIFRAMSLSFQEVAIALMGDRFEGYWQLKKFAFILGGLFSMVFILLALTPLSEFWFVHISGLSPDLARYAEQTIIFLLMIPAITMYNCMQRAIAVKLKATKLITMAVLCEVTVIVIALMIGIKGPWPGAWVACIALVLGRSANCCFLHWQSRSSEKAVKQLQFTAKQISVEL